MKKYFKFILVASTFVLTYSCTDMMDDMNNDPKSLTNARLEADGKLFKQHIIFMEKNLFNLTSSWQYQGQNSTILHRVFEFKIGVEGSLTIE